jgi:hypothetical protein
MDSELESTATKEIVHWIVWTAVHDDRLLAVKRKLQAFANDKDVAELQACGCDKEMLLNTVAYGAQLPTLYPPFTAMELKELAKDVESVLFRMKTLTPSIALPWLHDAGDGTQVVTTQPTGGGLHVWPELEQDLLNKAKMYKGLAHLCNLRLIPTRATFRRIAYVWPLVYVNSCTSDPEPHYAAVSRLLEFAGVEKDSRQLKKAFLSVREKYPEILEWL